MVECPRCLKFMANTALELELRRLLFDPPKPPEFDGLRIRDEIARPENLGFVDLNLATKKVFARQDNLLRRWQLKLGRWGLECEIWDWLDLPDWSARTVIEPRAVLPDSFLGRLVSNYSFRRLYEIYQWGGKRDEPATNPQERRGHTLEFLSLFDSCFNTLRNDQLETLLRVARRDLFAFEQTRGLSDEEILALYKKIGFLSILLHDIATPAGGDAIKPVLDGSKGSVFDEALELEAFLCMPQNAGLLKTIEDEGISPYLPVIFDIVAGRSDTLLGNFIAPRDRNRLKLDTISYLLYDCSWFHFLYHSVPWETINNPKDGDFPLFLSRLTLLGDDLIDPQVMIGGYHKDYAVPLDWLNVSKSVFITEDGQVGYADGPGLTMLLFLNAVMWLDCYQSPKMLIPEIKIQEMIKNLPQQAREVLLDRNFVLTAGNRVFYQRLERLVGKSLTDCLYSPYSCRRYLLPRDKFSAQDIETIRREYLTLHFFPNIGFNPRVETLTTRGGVSNSFKDLYAKEAEVLEKLRNTFNRNWVVMVDFYDVDPQLVSFLGQFPHCSSFRLI